MIERTYREDVDWLRAIAVLSVLFFHWDIPPFRGGYVGVDIFFVVSGFLITRIIEEEAGRGVFSFASFYERRVRRLLPALYVMAALVIVPSFIYFLPEERLDLYRSVLATVTFTSNLLFWQQSGYFGGEANEKPLLHTWSLSVEEQFYLVLPVVIVLLFRWCGGREGRRATLLFGIGFLAAASFALSEWLIRSERVEAAFYFSPPRAWEFLIGSLIAIEGIPVAANVHIRRGARILGLVLIAVAVIGYRKSTVFPGVSALLPCAGAVFFIWGGMGSGARPRAALSPLGLAGFFGRISYSLYLWHWPLFLYLLFAKRHLPPTPLELIVLFVIAVAISYASYRFVEQPVRRRSVLGTRGAAFAAAGIASVVLVVAGGVGMFATDLSVNDPSKRLRAYNSYPSWYRGKVCLVEKWRDFSDKECLTPVVGKKNILVWGDSAAAHYMLSLRQALDPVRVHLMQATGAACRASLTPLPDETAVCVALRERVAAFLKDYKPDMVVVAGVRMVESDERGFGVVVGAIRGLVAELMAHGIPVLVVGPSLEFKGRLPVLLLRAQAENVTPRASDLLVADIFSRDARMKEAVPVDKGRVGYVSVLDAACAGGECPLLMPDGTPVVIDHVHLTTEGATVVGRPVGEAARRLLSEAME